MLFTHQVYHFWRSFCGFNTNVNDIKILKYNLSVTLIVLVTELCFNVYIGEQTKYKR